MSSPSLQTLLVFEHRTKKRSRIYRFFETNLGIRVSSKRLHEMFGSAFRTRVSEINRDKSSDIGIHNEHHFDWKTKVEVSEYWSEAKNG